MIDTIRVLVAWECNLKCSYCCNEIERFRSEIEPVALKSIDFSLYRTVCVSGGEPLMHLQKLQAVCEAAAGQFLVLNTNGYYLNSETAESLSRWGIKAINVGLHYPATFGLLIDRALKAVAGLPIVLRFNLEDIHAAIPDRYPGVAFHFWQRNACERTNERRVVLTELCQLVPILARA